MSEFTANFTLNQIEAIESTFTLNESTQLDAVFVIHAALDRTSELINDSNYVADTDYVHTDNNYSDIDKLKLDGIEAGAEVNVNADYNATSGDAQILNKPDITAIARLAISETATGLLYDNITGVLSLENDHIIPTTISFNNKVDSESGKGLSENDFTDTLKSKLDGIESGAEVNTVDSVNTQIGAVVLDSDDIAEGVTHFYYTDTKVDGRITVQKGAINGIASLDGTGKVPSSQLPSTGGGITYMGTWDASTSNYPTATPNDGEFWVISVAGTIATVVYSVGDWIIYNTVGGWSRVPSGAAVSSVNSKTGTVVLTTTDMAEGTNEYYTETKVNNNTKVGNGVTAYGWGNHSSAGYAQDDEVVHLLGDELIYGNKTFDDTLVVNDRVAIGTAGFDPINPEFFKVDGQTASSFNIISAKSNYDSYVQTNLQNYNDGEYASSDFVATSDIGTESTNYVDFGINNSNYNALDFNIVKALDGYGFVEGGDLALGTITEGKVLRLFTGGSLEENSRLEISDTSITPIVPIAGYATTTTVSNKVDKITGKGLSTNDFTDTLKTNYDTAYTNTHTHINKILLDSLTSAGAGTTFLANDGTYKGVSAGSVAWGLITGTLSAQTDLQNALNATVHLVGTESITGAKTFNGGITIGAGSYTLSPLIKTAGTLNTNAITGTEEFYNNTFFKVPFDSSRAVDVCRHFYSNTSAFGLTNGASAQTIFGKSVSLSANTAYRMRGVFYIGTGATTHTTALTMAVTNALASCYYMARASSNALNTTASATASIFISSSAAKIINATSTAVSTVIHIEGIIRTSSATVLTPQVTFSSAPGTTCQTYPGSFIEFEPIGTSTDIQCGVWS